MYCFPSVSTAPPCIQLWSQETSTTLEQALIISYWDHCSDFLTGLLCTLSHTPCSFFKGRIEHISHPTIKIFHSDFQCSSIKTKILTEPRRFLATQVSLASSYTMVPSSFCPATLSSPQSLLLLII